jgi:hypothetical protein
MDQMFVWTVVYTQELQGRRRKRDWEEDYYRGFDDGPASLLLRSARRLAGRLFSMPAVGRNCHNRMTCLDHAGSPMIR